MARIYSPLGVIKGSVGNLTFSGGASDNQIRTKIARNTSNTPDQQEVRHRFAELAAQYSKLKAVFAIGFRKLSKLSPYNRYVQTNYEYTSVDQDLVASIDYPQMVVSAGGVLGVAGLTATVVAGGVAFTWQLNSKRVWDIEKCFLLCKLLAPLCHVREAGCPTHRAENQHLTKPKGPKTAWMQKMLF